MADNKNVPPEVQLYTEERFKEDRAENMSVFSAKWVEKAATWLLYAIGAIILAGIIKAAAPYLAGNPGQVTTGPTIQSAAATSTK